MIGKYAYGASKPKRGTSDFPFTTLGYELTCPRLRTANVLLITMRALSNEIAKNLVLAGVGSLTVLDNSVVVEDDLGAQFLISEQDLGRNVSITDLELFKEFLY